jgi:type II secretory pathway pseudopilin PulG
MKTPRVMQQIENGFTILEVLFGVSVFVIGLLGVIALMISSVNGNAFSSRLTEATALAANQLEVLMRTDYGSAPLLDADLDGLGGLHDATLATADGADEGVGRNNAFNVYWNNAPDQPIAGSTTVGITVTWSEKNAQRMLKVAGVRIDEF